MQHPHGGDLPLSQCVGQPVGIDDLGSVPRLAPGPAGKVVGHGGLAPMRPVVVPRSGSPAGEA
jgi:hypothetical protein